MKSEERRRCMFLLWRAKQGDVLACETLVTAVADHFQYMVRGYGSVDPYADYGDIFQEFRLGIWHAIERVDHRGDPLYHLAWRGQQAVRSLLAVIKQRRHGTANWVEEFGSERRVGPLPEHWDPADERPESDPQYVVEVVEERNEAHETLIRVRAHCSLTPRQEEVFNWMLRDPEPWELGANKRLAAELGVSEQAASVQRRKVVSKIKEAS